MRDMTIWLFNYTANNAVYSKQCSYAMAFSKNLYANFRVKIQEIIVEMAA